MRELRVWKADTLSSLFKIENGQERKFLKSWLVYDVPQGDSTSGQSTTCTDMAIVSFCSFLAIDLIG